jgi:hypothetical protein
LDEGEVFTGLASTEANLAKDIEAAVNNLTDMSSLNVPSLQEAG